MVTRENNILVIDNKSLHLHELLSVLQPHGSIEVVSYNEIEDQKIKNINVIVLSGGKKMDIPTHRKEFEKEVALIKSTSKPVLGICLGFELMLDATGGVLKKREERKTGIVKNTILVQDPIFGKMNSFSSYIAYKYYIEKVPPGFIGLAKTGPDVSVVKHAKKPIYGFNFHPEVIDEKNEGTQLLRNFMSYARGKR